MANKQRSLIGGYVRLSFKHIIRSLLVSIPACAGGAILTFIVAIVFDLISGMFGVGFKLMSESYIIFPCAICGLVAAFLIVSWICGFITYGKRSFSSDGLYTFRVSTSYPYSEHSSIKFPRYSVVVWQLVLHFLVFATVIVTIFLSEYEELVSTADDNVVSLILLMALPLLLATQIAYLFVGIGEYKRARCPKCKHVFCINEKSKTKAEYNTYGYSEKTSRENIGSIGSTQIYADVTRGKITTTHHTESDVFYNCCACGHSGKYKSHISYKK